MKNELPDTFELHITLVGKSGKRYDCPCAIPNDSLSMSKEELTKSYGPHLIEATYDLLHHAPFRRDIQKPKIEIVSS